MGEACGAIAIAPNWALESTEPIQSRHDKSAKVECMGEVCGPDATAPTWTLAYTTNECMGEACGLKKTATTSTLGYKQSARNLQPRFR
jgi:hypothetical protein